VGGELCVLTILFELLTRFSIVFTISMNVVMAVFYGYHVMAIVLEWTKSVSQKQRLRKLCQNFAFA